MMEVINIPQEFIEYKKCFIADVNNYVIEDIYGGLKLKGKYVYENISFEKNASNRISSKAAVKYLTEGIPVKESIKSETNIFNFCIGKRARNTPKKGMPVFTLFNTFEDFEEQQKTIRYIVTKTGGILKSVYSDGSMQILEAYPNSKKSMMSFKQTMMNKINSKNVEDYDIDEIYYIREANKMIQFSESKDLKSINQLKLF